MIEQEIDYKGVKLDNKTLIKNEFLMTLIKLRSDLLDLVAI